MLRWASVNDSVEMWRRVWFRVVVSVVSRGIVGFLIMCWADREMKEVEGEDMVVEDIVCQV
jgi:hypothetical protein